MSDCRIFALSKLLSSDTNEAHAAHFDSPLRARGSVSAERRQPTPRCAGSPLHKHSPPRAASERTPSGRANAGKSGRVLNGSSKGQWRGPALLPAR